MGPVKGLPSGQRSARWMRCRNFLSRAGSLDFEAKCNKVFAFGERWKNGWKFRTGLSKSISVSGELSADFSPR